MKYLLCLVFVIAPAFSAEWGYTDQSAWEDDYAKCGDNAQSPINIVPKDAEEDTELGTIEVSDEWESSSLTYTLSNNGHSAVIAVSGDTPTISGGGLPATYKLEQFHFHWASTNTKGSEHTVGGKSYPLEVHFVHYKSTYGSLADAADQEEGLAVIGVFFELGDENDDYANIFDKLSDITHKDDSVAVTGIELNKLLPDELDLFWRYGGSLTTPPCYESVVWTVMHMPVTISKDQLDKFRTLKENADGDTDVDMELNYRDVQALGDRTVKTSDAAFTAGSLMFVLVAALIKVIM